jgi:hypothetical protein
MRQGYVKGGITIHMYRFYGGLRVRIVINCPYESTSSHYP